MASLCALFPPSTSASSSSSRPQLHQRGFPSTFRIRSSSSYSSSDSSASTSSPRVVVTRERGKNGKLIKALVLVFHSVLLTLSAICLDVYLNLRSVGLLGFWNGLSCFFFTVI